MPSFLRKHPHAVVMFHASWCSHCRQLLPAFKAAAARVKLPLVMMQCDNAPELVEQYGLRGFPTILRFGAGRPIEYNGDRSPDSIVQFAMT